MVDDAARIGRVSQRKGVEELDKLHGSIAEVKPATPEEEFRALAQRAMDNTVAYGERK